MTRQHRIRISIARRLRLSADRFAAAAAVQDPSLLLQLKGAESDDEESSEPPPPPRRALTAETGAALLLVDGALLDAAKAGILDPVLLAPVLAAVATALCAAR